MLRVKNQHLIYRGPDGFGGFRSVQAYELRVGTKQRQHYLLYPVTQQPWLTQPTVVF